MGVVEGKRTEWFRWLFRLWGKKYDWFLWRYVCDHCDKLLIQKETVTDWWAYDQMKETFGNFQWYISSSSCLFFLFLFLYFYFSYYFYFYFFFFFFSFDWKIYKGKTLKNSVFLILQNWTFLRTKKKKRRKETKWVKRWTKSRASALKLICHWRKVDQNHRPKSYVERIFVKRNEEVFITVILISIDRW